MFGVRLPVVRPPRRQLFETRQGSSEWNALFLKLFFWAIDPAKYPRVVLLDTGAKANIVRALVRAGARVLRVPWDYDFTGESYDGLFLSNGPGDPAALPGMVAEVEKLIGQVPLFGICLGHQLLAQALGATTFKLRFGHRGGNHPVRDVETGRIEITSQNHGFCVDPEGIEAAGGRVTHVNLNDQTLAGFVHDDKKIMGIQFHPEAAPGPHDSQHLLLERFYEFAGLGGGE